METNEYYKKKINSDYLITVYHVIDKVKESIKSGKIDVSNENATYYIPLSCVNEDNFYVEFDVTNSMSYQEFDLKYKVNTDFKR